MLSGSRDEMLTNFCFGIWTGRAQKLLLKLKCLFAAASMTPLMVNKTWFMVIFGLGTRVTRTAVYVVTMTGDLDNGGMMRCGDVRTGTEQLSVCSFNFVICMSLQI